jgi:hypothetical protein
MARARSPEKRQALLQSAVREIAEAWSNTRFAGNPVASEGWSIQSSLGAVFVNAFGHPGKGELRGCYETPSSSASERLEWISDEKTSQYQSVFRRGHWRFCTCWEPELRRFEEWLQQDSLIPASGTVLH